MEYQDKVFRVTGASSGIGWAFCLQLAQKGAKLIVSGRDQNRLMQLLAECKDPHNHRVLSFDLGDADALPSIARKQGAIINMISVAGKVGSSLRSGYSGAKRALLGFMDCLRAEVAADGIRVINVCPGFVKTQY